VILITTDKGLCGGLNTNVLRGAHCNDARSWEGEGNEVRGRRIGNKGLGFLQRIGAQGRRHVLPARRRSRTWNA